MRQYLVQTIMAPYYRKSLFGNKYMLFHDYYNQSSILSKYCVTLGYMYKDNIQTLMELFANSKVDIKSNIEGISEMAELIEKNLNNGIKNIHDLFVETQMKKYIELFYKGKNLDYSNIEDLLKIRNDKIPLNIIVTLTELMIYSLIGFGYKFPALAEKLLTYKVDDEMYNLAIKAGLDIPERKLELSIEEHKAFSKELIKPYVSTYKPELIDKLELN